MTDFNSGFPQNNANMIPTQGIVQNTMPQEPNKRHKKQINGWFIATVCLIVVTMGLTILGVWLYINYDDQKTNVDTKIAAAVATAKKEQADKDEVKRLAAEKEPNREFVGPDDYGGLTFDYPKTWSVYVAKDASDGGNYEAYLNPITVPTVSSSQQFALRVTIEEKDYDKVVDSYSTRIKNGDLTSSSVSVDSGSGIRLDGSFSDDIRGSAVIYKIRDKTLTIRTDANTFKSDFDALIATIKFS